MDGKALSKEVAGAYLESVLDSYTLNGFGRYAVRLKHSHILIGMCGYRLEEYGVDFGYRFAWKY